MRAGPVSRTRGVAAALALTLAVTVPAVAAAEPGAETPFPLAQQTNAVGANDWACVPSAEHPRPVVLVHGTWGNQSKWDVLSERLHGAGYCVFALDHGHSLGTPPTTFGTADVRESSRELATFVDRVRTATRSAQVDLIGHSLGGVVARQYLRFDGGTDPADPARNTVHRLVEIAATNHGSSFDGGAEVLRAALGPDTGDMTGPGPMLIGPSVAQQLPDSRLLTELNAGGDTQPGVRYTVIASRTDATATPPESTFLTAGPGATVDNIWLQDVDPTDATEHGDLPSSPTVGRIVLDALGENG